MNLHTDSLIMKQFYISYSSMHLIFLMSKTLVASTIMFSHLTIFANNIFFLNRKESCDSIHGQAKKNAQLQTCPHSACSVYTGTLEREYLKTESFSIRFYLASPQLITVHLGKFYKNL